MKIKDSLKEFYEKHSEVLLRYYPGLTFQIYLKNYLETTNNELPQVFEKWCAKTLMGIPFAYILKKTHFFGYDLDIEDGLFIPRFETEMIVEMALNFLQNKNEAFVYDICVGPGTISLPLLIESKCKLELKGIDINPKALEYSLKNMQNYSHLIDSKTKKYSFIEGDRLYGETTNADLIVTNPPYIKKFSDSSTTHEQVKKFEPDIALFLDDSIYDEWFEKLLSDSLKLLKNGGLFLMEGHEDHLDSLKDLAFDVGFHEAIVINDLTNRKRFLKATKKN